MVIGIGLGNGLVSSCNKPLSEPIFTQFYVAYDISVRGISSTLITYRQTQFSQNMTSPFETIIMEYYVNTTNSIQSMEK